MNQEGDLVVTGARLDGETVGIKVTGGIIEAIGPDVHAGFAGAADFDAGGAWLCPPLVNAHTHAAMTLFRGHGDDLPLMRWLQEAIWPVEAKLDEEDVYWGTRLACLEMIRSGTTTFWDMYWQPEGVARAVTDSGVRAVVGPPMITPRSESDRAGNDRRLVEQLDALDQFGPRVGAAVAPHSIYTVDTAGLEFAGSLASERGLPIHIHLSETQPEVDDSVTRYGLRPAFYLDSLGLLGERTVLAHGVFLDRDELELIAERGATVVTNPVANMKLAVDGVFPYPEAKRAGIRIGLGTDGAGSNNSLDLMSDLKTFALIQRHAAASAEAIPVADAWAVATGRRSPLTGGPAPLEPGSPADFLLLDPQVPELALGEPVSNLVYSITGAAVRDTIVDGRVLMRNREVADHEEILVRARERATRLGL